MNRGTGVLVGVLVALVAVPAAPAAQPRWSAQTLGTPRESTTAGVGVDDAGAVTVMSFEGSRIVGRFRPPGQSSFSAPVDLGPVAFDYRDRGTERSAQLRVAGNGEVAVVSTDNVCVPWAPRSCTARLNVRTGPTIAQLSPPELLTENGHSPSLAVAPDGHMAVAWMTAPDDGAALEIALRPPRGGFSGARQRVGTEGPAGGPVLWREGPSVSINTRGEAAAVWQQSTQGVLQAKAAYREANSSFGSPQFVANSGGSNTNVEPKVAVDAQGGALVALAGPSPGFSWRPPRGSFSPHLPFPGTSWGHSLRLTSRPDAQVAAWAQYGGQPSTVRVAARSVGAAFGPVRTLQLPGFADGEFGADSRGNLHTAWMDGPYGSLRAATLDRLDLVPSELSGPLTQSGVRTGPILMAVNGRGQAAVIVSVGTQTPDGGLEPREMRLIERSPDATAPLVALRTAARRKGLTRARVRCSESCLAQATVTATYRQKRKTRRPVTRHSSLRALQRGSRHLFQVRLTRAERRRLQRLVRQRKSPKAYLAIGVEDSAGNRATSRRRVSLKRLLR